MPTADGSATAHSDRFGETYHSVNGAETESRHVFLNACQVLTRLETGQDTRVLEIGFGLGMNCLLTADAALQHHTALDYHTFEHDLISAADFRQCQYESLIRHSELLDWVADEVIGAAGKAGLIDTASAADELDADLTIHRRVFPDAETQRAALAVTLHASDATRSEMPEGEFDAIYLDAFSPDVNPECWTIEFFAQLRKKLADNGVMSTYSAKGSVRRGLIAAGFIVNKMAGPPGKREMLVATRAQR